MREVTMIRKTVRRVGNQLEQLADRDIPMTRAFDILSRKAKTIEETVVVEVMREVFLEIIEREESTPTYAESSTRSARIPSIALSR